MSQFERNGKGIRCHECEGFGYIQTECVTYLKRKKKSLVATFSDEEDYSESDDEEVRMELISITTENEERVENVNSKAFDQQATMSNDSINECTLKRKWEEDQAAIEAKNQLEELTKSVRMLTNGTQKLDDLIDQGRRCIDKRGLGFSRRKATENETKTMFVQESVTQNSQAENAKGNYMKNATSLVKWLFQAHDRKCRFFSELSECNAGSVVFGDGGKGRIIGKGTINHPEENMYNLSQSEEATLWHKRLGHISGTSIGKAVKAEAIIGLPPLSFNSRECYSNCPDGKQVKSSHKPTNQSSTTRILELLHIDLIGPMQTESLGGKRYALGNHSQQIRTAGSEHFSLTEDNGNSSSHSNVNSITIPVEATSVDHLETGTNEASISVWQPTNEVSIQGSDTTDTVCSSTQKLMLPTHIVKNLPSSSIIEDVYSGVTTRKKEMRDYAKMVANVCYTPTVKPTTVIVALIDDH
ncbi:Retrovirus-related Pol polyprotein from transposon TNT 1-94 [Cucumis melo var. makuwa]|uniref:Retrovirus-related Pol polyprotein from transposon TNT 1-94 n=1 Tax=Cucumis melo var. makuwa TaxID=1194695 RepID=A0A5A7VH49_CUCMM|nr:Retrovirus-related Pol polyprotein from transposon TNT 1-94 [Cucumis melo var. makuwa]